MGEQHIPLQIDENNNVTKVGNELESFSNDIYEKCILCEVETTTLKTTHIDFRTGYIEGAGQLCSICYMKGSSDGRKLIVIPKYLIEQYPNNMQLGEAVRAHYWEHYK